MKIIHLINGLLVSLLFSATTVGADSKYPATDFQPKVVYHASGYKQDGADASSSSESKGATTATDADYPAANFQPEVVYQDKQYKHTKSKVSNPSYTDSTSNSNSNSTQSSKSVVKDTSYNLLIGLVLAAVAGFLLYKKGNQSSPFGSRCKTANSADGVSGVARYLEGKAGHLASGVAKYLAERESVAASGVAKYLAKQKILERPTGAANASGVEKYLREKS